MRTLCKKALALCVVFALALTCFVGTLSVSAADPYDATLTVADVDVNFGDTTATAVLHIAVAAPGINEAIINIDSTIGTIDAEPTLDLETLVVDGGGDAYVDVVGDDFSKLFLSARRDPAVTELNGILTADIAVEFTLNEGVKPGTYPINIVTEGVKAADKNETVVNLVYATEENPAGNFIVTCKHNNLVEDAELWVAPTCTKDGSKTFVCDDCKEYSYTEVDPATGHAEELTYTSKEDGTHSVDCPNCEDVFEAEDCVDKDANGACDKCGYVMVTEPEGPIAADDLKIRSAGVRLANGFGLNFKVRKSMETLGYTDIYLEFKKPRYDEAGNLIETLESVVYADGRTNDESSAENWLYTLEGIQPQEMATMITATIYGYKDGKLYKGATVDYSVLKFAHSQLKNLTNASAATTTQIACADMINFAISVQNFTNYNIANPIMDAADELFAGSKVWQDAATKEVTRELVNSQQNFAFDGATVRIRSAGVTLDSKVVLFFNCADLGVQTLANYENYKVHVTYEDVQGEEKVYDLEIGADFKARLDTLYSTELGTVVTAYMTDAQGNQVSNSVTYSIETFVNKNITNATNGAWCDALIKYGDSVRTLAGLN